MQEKADKKKVKRDKERSKTDKRSTEENEDKKGKMKEIPMRKNKGKVRDRKTDRVV